MHGLKIIYSIEFLLKLTKSYKKFTVILPLNFSLFNARAADDVLIKIKESR